MFQGLLVVGPAEHSDKDVLHNKAEEVRRDEATQDYQERKQRVTEVCVVAHTAKRQAEMSTTALVFHTHSSCQC